MKAFFLFLIVLFADTVYSQKDLNRPVDTANVPVWVNMMQDPKANFFETQRAFQLYWKDRTVTKGSGYNVFKRWEYINSKRIDKDGWIIMHEVPLSENLEDNDLQKRASFSASSFDSSHGCSEDSLWIELGPNNLADAGRINAIAFHPSDTNTFWVGAPAGGLWKTTDGGKSWTLIWNGLPTMGISSIAVDHTNPDIIYAGTGDKDAHDSPPYGIYKTTDGGKTWFPINKGFGKYNLQSLKLVMDPVNPRILLSSMSGGIYRTIDAGAIWTLSMNFYGMDLVIHHKFRNIVYATQQGDFYKSTDSGKTFNKISKGLNSGYRGAIAITKHDDSYVYFLLCEQNSMVGVYRSSNYGDSFKLVADKPNLMDRDGADGGGQAFYCMDIAVSPVNKNEVYVGGVSIFRSINGGSLWNKYTGSAHVDIHAIEYNPLNNRLYIGCDGGLWTNDPKQWWVSLSKGLGIHQAYKISTCNTGKLMAGFQDNGSWANTSIDSKIFGNISGGDGMDNAFNYSNPSIRYYSYQNGVIVRNNKTIAAAGVNGINESGGWVTPFVLMEKKQDVMLAGYENLWMSSSLDSAKVTFNNVCKGPALKSGSFITDIENSPADNNILFFARGNTLYRTSDLKSSSPTWNIVANPVMAIQDVQCDYFNKNKVYMAVNKHVYISTDGGFNWSVFSDSLPETDVYCIAIDSSSKDGGMYCGTFMGIYYRDDKLGRWVKYYKGFPENLEPLDMDISYNNDGRSKHRLLVGTYGRGIWQAPLMTYTVPKPEVNLSVSLKKACVGKSILFSDSTEGLYLRHQWSVWPSASFEGQDSSSPDVAIRFDKPGRYNITKMSKNCLYNDTFIYEDMLIFDTLGKALCIPKSVDRANSSDYGITYAGISNISQFSNGTFVSGSYEDFSCHTLGLLKPGKKYQLSVRVSDTNAQFIKAYIDFNNDGQFSENTELLNSYYSPGYYKDSISIPWNAVFNKTLRMRVVADYITPGSACDDLFYGQAEDYSVIIEYEKARFSANKKNACVNETVIYNDSSEGIFNTYEWDFGSGAVPSTASGKGPHRVTYSQDGYKRVRLDLNNGLYTIMDSAVFIVPSSTWICTSNGRDTLCSGDELRISPCKSDSKNTDYKWYKDNTLLSTTSGMLLIENCKAGDAGIYTLNAKNECRNDTSGILKIAVLDAPNAAMSVDKAQACLDSANFDLRNLSNIGNGRMSYKWEIADGRSFTDSNLQISFDQSGKFRVRLISENSGFCADTAGVDLIVYPLPSAIFRVKPESGLAYRFTPDSIQYKSYFWDFGDGDTSWQVNPLHKFSMMNNYKISLEVNSMTGCHDSVHAYLYKLLTSIGGIEKSTLYSIQPNPNDGRFSLIVNLQGPSAVTVDLISYDGKIHAGIINDILQENNKHIQFDLEALGLDPGLYLMRLKTGEETYFARISYLR